MNHFTKHESEKRLQELHSTDWDKYHSPASTDDDAEPAGKRDRFSKRRSHERIEGAQWRFA